MDEQTERIKESNNSDPGILLDNPNISVSQESSSSGEKNPNGKMIQDPSNSVNAGEILRIREGKKDIGIQIDNKSIEGPVLETVILVDSEENRSIRSGLEAGKVTVDKSMKNGERVCRICHLGSEGLAETKATSFSAELMQLGCGCKDELGIAHGYCAEAWFKLKGNRICEICGEMARNITGVGDNRFMENWNQRRFVGTSISIPADGSNGCWRTQPFCNFLMGCLVVAFVLPWFFRVNIF